MVNYYEDALDRTFAALADPTRRAILSRVSAEECRVTDIAEPFDMSLPAVTKHLNVLERAGLIHRRKDGRLRRCKLDSKPLKHAASWIEQYRVFWEGQFDRLADYLESTKAGPKPKKSSRKRGNRR